MGGCTCGLLPCICVQGNDEAGDFPYVSSIGDHHGLIQPQAPKSKLRTLVAGNAMTQCSMCMFLPCICPADNDAPFGDEENTSVEATSPFGSDVGGSDNLDDDEDTDEVTDAFGRVCLTSRPLTCDEDDVQTSEASDVWIAKEIKRLLKPHQVRGVQFLYDHIMADRGCILADYMGLGKTLQVITVIYSFMIDHFASYDESDVRPVTTIVLCPAICIPNWESEFKKWLSVESLVRCPVFAFDSVAGKTGSMQTRIRVLQRWKREGGVLLMGYEMFRSLLNPTVAASVDRDAAIQVCSRVSTATMDITHSIGAKSQKSSRDFFKLLCEPGADLVVLDEGHRMKDPTSLLCQSVGKIHSKRRLVLTGYPVQVCQYARIVMVMSF